MTFTILSSLKSLQRKNVFVKGGNDSSLSGGQLGLMGHSQCLAF